MKSTRIAPAGPVTGGADKLFLTDESGGEFRLMVYADGWGSIETVETTSATGRQHSIIVLEPDQVDALAAFILRERAPVRPVVPENQPSLWDRLVKR
jgi:hypothetical protein